MLCPVSLDADALLALSLQDYIIKNTYCLDEVRLSMSGEVVLDASHCLTWLRLRELLVALALDVVLGASKANVEVLAVDDHQHHLEGLAVLLEHAHHLVKVAGMEGSLDDWKILVNVIVPVERREVCTSILSVVLNQLSILCLLSPDCSINGLQVICELGVLDTEEGTEETGPEGSV